MSIRQWDLPPSIIIYERLLMCAPNTAPMAKTVPPISKQWVVGAFSTFFAMWYGQKVNPPPQFFSPPSSSFALSPPDTLPSVSKQMGASFSNLGMY
eukprot:CAMPEP_0181132884 /NCGR_PEP_ID=MMETSP1071-20121207/31239_1 /TAXON_ID=35127 /ORGANISM="Thalassiosira sp., Strain NH16" /LENGTH=95 /DNA_ID=CAMNT_0023219259 /DNA_START=196 /DNA_END=480 /DNA_ORIENTATION=+